MIEVSLGGYQQCRRGAVPRRTVERQISTMEFGHRTDQKEAETGPLIFATKCAIDLVEWHQHDV
jgi:hypothetical protein